MINTVGAVASIVDGNHDHHGSLMTGADDASIICISVVNSLINQSKISF